MPYVGKILTERFLLAVKQVRGHNGNTCKSIKKSETRRLTDT